jgi:hypothetical protein
MRHLLLFIVLVGVLVGTFSGCSGSSTDPVTVKQSPNNPKRRGE